VVLETAFPILQEGNSPSVLKQEGTQESGQNLKPYEAESRCLRIWRLSF